VFDYSFGAGRPSEVFPPNLDIQSVDNSRGGPDPRVSERALMLAEIAERGRTQRTKITDRGRGGGGRRLLLNRLITEGIVGEEKEGRNMMVFIAPSKQPE
jgi:hypothetical protein